ncbi:MAG: SCO family protein [Myxococcota bacterium]
MTVVHRIFGSWRFPAFTLAALGSFAALMAVALALPTDRGALGDFAEDFKIWCFGYDPATGRLQWAYVVVFLFQPLAMAAIVFWLWRDTFRGVTPRALAPWVSAGLLGVSVSAVAMASVEAPTREAELPFPAESLRTALPTPTLALTDHTGARVDLAALRGKVVLITAVYARCGGTCPTLLAQAGEAVAAVGPTPDLVVLAVTLDPAHDTVEVLSTVAENRGLSSPPWRLLTGPVAEVEAALDDLAVSRRRDPVSGVVDHANAYVLVDRAGRVAYRLTLGDRQRRWLPSALRVLLAEAP